MGNQALHIVEMQRHERAKVKNKKSSVKLVRLFANVYVAFCVCYQTSLNTENKSSLELISFKIHRIPFSPTTKTHYYNEIDEFTERQKTAAKKQSHVASNVRWKEKSKWIVEIKKFFTDGPNRIASESPRP